MVGLSLCSLHFSSSLGLNKQVSASNLGGATNRSVIMIRCHDLLENRAVSLVNMGTFQGERSSGLFMIAEQYERKQMKLCLDELFLHTPSPFADRLQECKRLLFARYRE